jgi:small subunit ribosomal protein S20
MPITSSAKKALRQSRRRRSANRARKDALRDAVKSYRALIAKKDLDGARAALPSVFRALDKTAKKGTIKKNTASRLKSRLSKLAR